MWDDSHKSDSSTPRDYHSVATMDISQTVEFYMGFRLLMYRFAVARACTKQFYKQSINSLDVWVLVMIPDHRDMTKLNQSIVVCQSLGMSVFSYRRLPRYFSPTTVNLRSRLRTTIRIEISSSRKISSLTFVFDSASPTKLSSVLIDCCLKQTLLITILLRSLLEIVKA
jgi:hypothetical protein